MLMVLEIAPGMKGWAAAIMRIWLSADRKRVPSLPQGLAQSNTDRCMSRKPGAPSSVMAPQQWRLAAAISAAVKPSAVSRSKAGSLACASVKPSARQRSEEHKSELQSLMRISYAVFGLKKKNQNDVDN